MIVFTDCQIASTWCMGQNDEPFGVFHGETRNRSVYLYVSWHVWWATMKFSICSTIEMGWWYRYPMTIIAIYSTFFSIGVKPPTHLKWTVFFKFNIKLRVQNDTPTPWPITIPKIERGVGWTNIQRSWMYVDIQCRTDGKQQFMSRTPSNKRCAKVRFLLGNPPSGQGNHACLSGSLPEALSLPKKPPRRFYEVPDSAAKPVAVADHLIGTIWLWLTVCHGKWRGP